MGAVGLVRMMCQISPSFDRKTEQSFTAICTQETIAISVYNDFLVALIEPGVQVGRGHGLNMLYYIVALKKDGRYLLGTVLIPV